MRFCLLLTLLLGLPLPALAGGVLVMGDSISAAYGLDKSRGWVALLTTRLQQNCHGETVINASVSGETSAGGLARLPALIKQHQPELVIIELGGNDGLRGLSPMSMRANLKAMVVQSRASGARVVLLGMRIPPNYGQAYTQLFDQQFRLLAEQLQLPWVPFFLQGVVQAGQLQADGIHPTAAAQPALLENAWPLIRNNLSAPCRP
ncbi:MAG: arylesterase [Alcanivorax sp.]|nr:arylesterase [Alcanivorax sp.]